MSEYSPKFEQIAQEEEKRKNDEQKISRRDFLKKTGLTLGALAAGASALETVGCAREDQRVEEEEKKMRKLGEKMEEKIKREELEEEIKKDPRAGYADLEHYLKDYPEVKRDPAKLKEAKEYFESRKGK